MNFQFEIVLIILCFLVQAVLSGFETAAISLNRFKLFQTAEKGEHSNLILHFLLDQPKILSTTSIGSNIAIVGSSTISASIFLHFFPEFGSLINTLFLTPFSLIFAEFLPKSLFYRNAYSSSLLFGPFVRMIYYFIFPFVWLVNQFSRLFLMALGISYRNESVFVSREEIKSIFSHFFQIYPKWNENVKMMDKSLEIAYLPVKQVMIPLVEVTAYPSDLKVNELLTLLRKKKYTNIPVYQERVDYLIGIVNVFDVMSLDSETRIKDITKKPLIFPENKNAMDCLIEMSSKNQDLCFAADEFGGISGIISLKDIWQYITGTIEDEVIKKKHQSLIIQEGAFVFDGKSKINELNEKYHMGIPLGDYETINGYIITHLGRIPQVGEEFNLNHSIVTILEATDRHINKVKVKKMK